MMIDWQIDQDSRRDLTSDLVGDIFLTEGKTSIVERNTYLDSWLEALIAGLNEMVEGRELALDLIEEPDPLILKSSGNEVRISYKAVTLLTTVADFRSALTVAARRFTEEARDAPQRPTSKELSVLIQRFLNENPAL